MTLLLSYFLLIIKKYIQFYQNMKKLQLIIMKIIYKNNKIKGDCELNRKKFFCVDELEIYQFDFFE